MSKRDNVVTIQHVARRAKVSTATVSHVINDTRFVSDVLTARVNEAIVELGYIPNQIIASLRKQKSYLIGVVIPSITNETYGKLVESIQMELMPHGYNVMVCSTSYSEDLEYNAFETLMMKQCDAIIAVPTRIQENTVGRVAERGIKCIVLDREAKDYAVYNILLDNYAGVVVLMNHLKELGHRHIAYIDRKVTMSHSQSQRQAYEDQIAKFGCSEPIIETATSFSYEGGYEAAKKLLRVHPEITAIMGYFDHVAQGAIRAIWDEGLRVPQDISVAGFDAMPFTSFTVPRLTSLQFPVEQIAKKITNEILRESKGSAIYRHTVIGTKLIIGESTSKCRRTR